MKNRTKIVNLKSYFIKCPSKILDLGLNPISICIYLALCNYSEDYNPTLGKLSRDLKLHRNTICKGLKTLCDCNVITKVSQGYVMRSGNTQTPGSESKQSIYQFNNPEVWLKHTDNKSQA